MSDLATEAMVQQHLQLKLIYAIIILTSVLRDELFLSKAFAMACNGSTSFDSASAHKLKIGMYSVYTSRRSVSRK